MIAPAYYRSLLSPEAQNAYRVIVNGLLQYRSFIALPPGITDSSSIQKIVLAVHLDHPELFYVDFWHYLICRNMHDSPVGVEFRMLLKPAPARAVSHTLSHRAAELQEAVQQIPSLEQQYRRVIRQVAADITYVNSGSAFWDHTAAGPVLHHTAVCEGIAKLFLFFCQRSQLPCAVVFGSWNGGPHAWNMVETSAGIRYVDVTGLLDTPSLSLLRPASLFQTEAYQRQSGYEYD